MAKGVEGGGPSGDQAEALLLVGSGRAAWSLAPTLHACGVRWSGVLDRTPARAQALARSLDCPALTLDAPLPPETTAVWLLVADDAITPVAETLAVRAWPGLLWVHAAGSRSESALAAAVRRAGGGLALAWHPLAVLDGRPRRLDGVTVTMSGSEEARRTGERWARCLGARTVYLPEGADRTGYHLAAALAAGHVVGLLGQAVAVARSAGLEDTVAQGLYGLAMEAVRAAQERGDAAAAATGPVVRGDAGTIDLHLAWLRDRVRELGVGVVAGYAGAGLALAELLGDEDAGDSMGARGDGTSLGRVRAAMWEALSRLATDATSGAGNLAQGKAAHDGGTPASHAARVVDTSPLMRPPQREGEGRALGKRAGT